MSEQGTYTSQDYCLTKPNTETESSVYNSGEMFSLGCAFMYSGDANLHGNAIKPKSRHQHVVGVVNLAFACELFMKCMINMSDELDKPLKEHKLNELWKRYKSKCEADAAVIEKTVKNQIDTEFTFEEMLRDDSNVFYNYRYPFEPDRLTEIRANPLRPQFLIILSRTLYQYISCKLNTDGSSNTRDEIEINTEVQITPSE